MKQLWEKFIVWIRLQQLQADGLIQKQVMEGLKKNMKVEEQERCDHNMLVKMIDKNIFYRCNGCGRVFGISVAPSWSKEGFKELLKKLEESKE